MESICKYFFFVLIFIQFSTSIRSYQWGFSTESLEEIDEKNYDDKNLKDYISNHLSFEDLWGYDNLDIDIKNLFDYDDLDIGLENLFDNDDLHIDLDNLFDYDDDDLEIFLENRFDFGDILKINPVNTLDYDNWIDISNESNLYDQELSDDYDSWLAYFNDGIYDDKLSPIDDSNDLPILRRQKRGYKSRSRSGSSRSRSSSSSRSSSKSSSGKKSSSSSSRGIWKKPSSTKTTSGIGSILFGRKKPSTTKSSNSDSSGNNYGWNTNNKNTGSSSSNSPFDKKPSAPPLEGTGSSVNNNNKWQHNTDRTSTNTQTSHHSPYPNAPQPGYPHPYPKNNQGGQQPGYPHSSPGNNMGIPQSGYPHSSPGNNMGTPQSGYPHSSTGNNMGTPQSGYPYPSQNNNLGKPQPGYPYPTSKNTPGIPQPGYPHQTGGNYPSSNPQRPHSGYPHPSGTNYNMGGSNFPKTSGPGFQTPMKKSKTQKIKEKVQKALIGYATYKMSKKGAKYISPYHMGSHASHFGGIPGNFGSSSGKSSTKLVKKVLGAALKIQIAKYAMKFGVKAAKLYFEMKLGRPLKEVIIQKFISRYPQQRRRHYFRENRRFLNNNQQYKEKQLTLGEECARDCVPGKPLTCLFSFHVQLYQSMSRACNNGLEDIDCVPGSGTRKLQIVVNKQLPAPKIQVCKGDEVLVEVHNRLLSSGLTLHFRGQSYKENPRMEGTPGVTQIPIPPGDTFTYILKADNPGTHFWHANTGVLRGDGVYGAFIVQDYGEPHQNLYDVDLVDQPFIVSEQFEETAEEQLTDINNSGGSIRIQSLLINGIGMKMENDFKSGTATVFPSINTQSGSRTRMRVISAVSSNCPFSLRIKNHQMKVIFVDGNAVEAKNVEELVVFPGERFDVVLNVVLDGLHWIEVEGRLDCMNKKQYAALQSTQYSPNLPSIYEGAVSLPTLDPRTYCSNKIESCTCEGVTCSRNLTSSSELPSEMLKSEATVYLSLTNRHMHNERHYSLLHYDIHSMPVEERSTTLQINNLTLKLPYEPLLQNPKPLNNKVCSAAGVLRQHCVEDFCECLHLLELKLGAVVDIIFINEGVNNSVNSQTMYFHGHSFWVLSHTKYFIPSNDSLDNSTLPYINRLQVIIKDAEDLLVRNVQKPLKMNSVTIPGGGYSIIRFKAENAGFWLLESSSIFNSANGMGIVIKVGEEKADLS